MKKVKITILKTTFDKDLAAEYKAEGLTSCPSTQTAGRFDEIYTILDGLNN